METKNYIWKKEYADLSKEELEYVSEWCENASDFEQVRFFMMNMSQVEKKVVSPSTKMKDELLSNFPSQQNQKPGFWMNIYGFIFPQNSPFNWKPILAIATVIGLIFTVVFVFQPFQKSEGQLADNTKKENMEQNPGSINEEENEESSSAEDELEAESINEINDKYDIETKSKLNEEVNVQQNSEKVVGEIQRTKGTEGVQMNEQSNAYSPLPSYSKDEDFSFDKQNDIDDLMADQEELKMESDAVAAGLETRSEEKAETERNYSSKSKDLFSRKKSKQRASSTEFAAPAAKSDVSEGAAPPIGSNGEKVNNSAKASNVNDVHQLLYTTY